MEARELESAFQNYETLSAMLKERSYEEILNAAAALADVAPEALERRPMGGYSKGMTSDAYRFALRDLLKNIQHYDWLFSRLEDRTSRLVLANLLGYRVLPAQSFLKAAYDGKNPQYFDKAIVSCGRDEVFVDCGGSSSTFMAEQKSSDSQGIQIVSLDEDIREPITFLKMDIEGFEIPALLGAKRHIRDDFPKLAVCTYHIVSDLWEIPRLIDAIHPGYHFYLRHYDYPQNWETVLYAIPEVTAPASEIRVIRKQKRVVSLPFNEGWSNSQLLKDCGVIPYLLHKNHGCDAVMAGAKMGEYSNLQYVPGMRLEFLPDGDKVAWLENEASSIDCLLLYGPYGSYFSLVSLYKRLNPYGKVCLALDANSHWMDRIQWAEPAFRRFMDQCDVITCSGRAMQRHLNEKWPWPIEFIPNGFYNFSSKPWSVDFSRKENVILTVGRLGTPQKATDVLLEAFAKIAPQVPDWELHLAGGVEDAFTGWLDEFWERHPELKERVRFLGSISDRDVLYETYQRAKIFALTSTFEGFLNVIPEALFSGDAIAISRIDEYQDATDHGRCGLAADVRDVDGFADILLRLCRSKELEAMCRNAYDYARKIYGMERIVARLHTLIFGGEA